MEVNVLILYQFKLIKLRQKLSHLLTLSSSKIIVLSVNNQTYVTFSQGKGLKPIIILSVKEQKMSVKEQLV